MIIVMDTLEGEVNTAPLELPTKSQSNFPAEIEEKLLKRELTTNIQ